ncbi:hypothetical protein [uncultured Williamsia sp.]|uniref:hypothetical protein n=1 Tax=uncultured Williamsia sp. TaxID=259311 RepID=UPI0026077488|nr:hypothetical protein [uncultured Williamsia sp.]
MLESSSVAPLLHMPVSDILTKHLGLPPLPAMPSMPPLPAMPPLPTIDLASLFKPLTDLLSGFGSGTMASAPFDPTQLFDGLQKAFESVFGVLSQAMSAVTPFWAGAGGSAAMATGAQANVNNVETGGQSGDISRIVATATATVAKGVAMLQGVIASFAASLAPLIPAAITPIGQAGIIASATAHLSEGLAVVAETRAELTAHTATMTISGHPIPITAAPQAAAAVPGMASSAVQAVTSPVQSIMGAVGGAGLGGGLGRASSLGRVAAGADTLAARSDGAAAARAAGAAGGGGAGGGVGGVGGIGGLGGGAGNAPLTTRPADAPVAPSSSRAGSSSQDEVVTRGATTTGTVGPAGMPMGAAGAGASASSSTSHTADRETSVDARHTDEVVGESPTAAPSVLGGVEPTTAQSIWDSPDELDT